jgi:hypothetical protein
MDNNLEIFFDANSNEFFSTKSLILNYANHKTYHIKNLAWFFNQRVEYEDYVCVSFSPSDNEYLCNKNTLLELIDYLKFSKFKFKPYHIKPETKILLSPVDPESIQNILHGKEVVFMLEDDLEMEEEIDLIYKKIRDTSTFTEINPKSDSQRDKWIQNTRKNLLVNATDGERSVADILDFCDIEYEREVPFVITHKDYHGTTQSKIFFADFTLANTNVIIEVDGSAHYPKKSRAKDDKKWFAFARAGYVIVRLNTYKVHDHSYILRKLSRHLPKDFPAYLFV